MSAHQRTRRHRLAAVFLASVTAVAPGCAAVSAQDVSGPKHGAPSATTTSLDVPLPSGVDTAPVIDGPVPDGVCRESLRPRPFPALAAEPAVKRIIERGFLRVGTSFTNNRLSYFDVVSGEMAGFEIDIVGEVARALFPDVDENPERIRYVEVNVGDLGVLSNGDPDNGTRVDLMAASMTMTCERAERVAFSAEYLSSGQRLLVSRDSPVRSVDDLGGRPVCASRGSTSIRRVARLPVTPPVRPVTALNSTDCLYLLQRGTVEAVSTGDVLLVGLVDQDRSTHMVGPRISDEPVGAAASRDAPELVRLVNGVLEKMHENGAWARSYQRWLSGLGPASPPVLRYRDER